MKALQVINLISSFLTLMILLFPTEVDGDESIEFDPPIDDIITTMITKPPRNLTKFKGYRTVKAAKVYKMNCNCGIAKRGEVRNSSASSRIVNGYEPYNRPWMVYIQIKGQTGEIGTCGGSLINKKWVLSAGHCFCKTNPCKKENDKTVVDYSPAERVKCVIGLKDITVTPRYKDYLFGVSEVIIHPRYFPNTHDQSDLSLVKLSREVEINSVTMPICMPESERFPDSSGIVYVAGWGLLQDTFCTTTDAGPDPFTKCKFPFHYLSMPNYGCSRTPSPSSFDKLCQQLVKDLKINPFPPEGYSQANIYNDQGKIIAECFKLDDTRFGWCGTCQITARPGTHGYCGTNSKNESNEYTEVMANRYWGFCGKHCSVADPMKNMLQEAKLEILPKNDCEKMAKAMKVLTNVEMCAAKPVFRRQDAYLAVKKKDSYSFSKMAKATQTRDTSFKFGGTDACAGDSGGPLWKWMGKAIPKATIVGVVSRGKGCARKDAPGLYTRTKKYLKWIFSHVKDGMC